MVIRNQDFIWIHTKLNKDLKNPISGILKLFNRIGVIAKLLSRDQIDQIDNDPDIKDNLCFKQWKFDDDIFQAKYEELSPNFCRIRQARHNS